MAHPSPTPRLGSRGHHGSQLINESCSSLSAIGRTHATSYCHPFILTKMVSLTLRTLPLWPFSVVDLEFGEEYMSWKDTQAYIWPNCLIIPFSSGWFQYQEGFHFWFIILFLERFLFMPVAFKRHNLEEKKYKNETNQSKSKKWHNLEDSYSTILFHWSGDDAKVHSWECIWPVYIGCNASNILNTVSWCHTIVKFLTKKKHEMNTHAQHSCVVVPHA